MIVPLHSSFFVMKTNRCLITFNLPRFPVFYLDICHRKRNLAFFHHAALSSKNEIPSLFLSISSHVELVFQAFIKHSAIIQLTGWQTVSAVHARLTHNIFCSSASCRWNENIQRCEAPEQWRQQLFGAVVPWTAPSVFWQVCCSLTTIVWAVTPPTYPLQSRHFSSTSQMSEGTLFTQYSK